MDDDEDDNYDDDGVGQEQAQRLRRALEAAEIEVGALWLRCFRLGGEVGEVEIDAYLHQALVLPPLERDLLAHAANELIGHGPDRRAPYCVDLRDGGRQEKADGGTGEAGGDGGPGGAGRH